MALLMKRWIAGGAALLTAAALAVGLTGCQGGDSALVPENGQRTSPSGQFTAEFASEGSGSDRRVYPVITDDGGTVVWADDTRYLMSAHPVGVAWQSDEDVLWLLSSDIGTARVVQTDGVWAKDWDWTTLPPDIEAIRG